MLGYALRFRRRHIRRVAVDQTEAVAERSALVLAPHPDDETLGCGAIIMRKLAAGATVTLVIVADGRHSHRSAYVSPERLATIRQDEMIEAARRLGIAAGSLRQLGYEDGRLVWHEDELVDVIVDLIKETDPDEVYVTGAFEPHPDHAALGRAARRATQRLANPPLLMEYPIWMWSQMWDGGMVVPWRTRLSTVMQALLLLFLRRAVKVQAAEFTAAKMHALDAHASQMGNPPGVPETERWWALPEPLMDAARDSVELFAPWRPTS